MMDVSEYSRYNEDNNRSYARRASAQHTEERPRTSGRHGAVPPRKPRGGIPKAAIAIVAAAVVVLLAACLIVLPKCSGGSEGVTIPGAESNRDPKTVSTPYYSVTIPEEAGPFTWTYDSGVSPWPNAAEWDSDTWWYGHSVDIYFDDGERFFIRAERHDSQGGTIPFQGHFVSAEAGQVQAHGYTWSIVVYRGTDYSDHERAERDQAAMDEYAKWVSLEPTPVESLDDRAFVSWLSCLNAQEWINEEQNWQDTLGRLSSILGAKGWADAQGSPVDAPLFEVRYWEPYVSPDGVIWGDAGTMHHSSGVTLTIAASWDEGATWKEVESRMYPVSHHTTLENTDSPFYSAIDSFTLALDLADGSARYYYLGA